MKAQIELRFKSNAWVQPPKISCSCARRCLSVCLCGRRDENVIFKSLKQLHPNLKWEQMHSKMGRVWCLSASAYFVCACKFPLSLL